MRRNIVCYQKLDHCIMQFESFNCLAVMRCQPLYNAGEKAAINSFSFRSYKIKSARFRNISCFFFSWVWDDYSQLGAIISNPTCTGGINVKYSSFYFVPTTCP